VFKDGLTVSGRYTLPRFLQHFQKAVVQVRRTALRDEQQELTWTDFNWTYH
jgi:hypothetical protein